MAVTHHALVFPYPAQSHVISLLELSYCLVDRGFKVTFLNTEFNHGRLLATLSKEHPADPATEAAQVYGGVRFASIPDGLGPDEDRSDFVRAMEKMLEVMPARLEEFIVNGEERFTCFVADQCISWALGVAKKAGLRTASQYPASATVLALALSIPKLIADGVIDEEGEPKKQELFQLTPEMPLIHTAHLSWNCFHDKRTKKAFFDFISYNNKLISNEDVILCNSFYELEKPVFNYAPNILPVGPLLTGARSGQTVGNFWEQDTECIHWLDQQQKSSVVYIAFGSFTIFNQHQFQELAMGLELAGKPFLLVARPDLTNFNDDSFINLSDFSQRVGERGRIIGWSPQPQVLAHPSIACFVSHCGWNSTMEGVRNAVPFLCWPYFGDQLLNESYICDVWRIGLRIVANENGIYSKEEISSKLKELIGDEDIKERSLALKEMAAKSLKKGGSSFNNFNSFIDLMKGV